MSKKLRVNKDYDSADIAKQLSDIVARYNEDKVHNAISRLDGIAKWLYGDGANDNKENIKVDRSGVDMEGLRKLAKRAKGEVVDEEPKPTQPSINVNKVNIPTTKYITNGTMITPQKISLDNISEKLKPAVYIPFVDDKGNVHLNTMAPSFAKVDMFGPQIKNNMDMLIDAYNKHGRVTLLMIGQKGSGKTMTAEAICNFLIGQGKPVVYLDTDLPANMLHQLIREIGDCVLFIDEFDKRYQNIDDPYAKDKLLGIFSDASLDKVSFIVAGNEKHRMSEYVIDRPSRFMFCIEYKGISPVIVHEMCKLNKLDDEITSIIIRYTCVQQCSFDVVNAVIKLAKEVNGDIGEMINRAYTMNVPDFCETNIRLSNIRSPHGMVSGCGIKQDKNGITFTVEHENDQVVVVKTPAINNDDFIKRSFTIDDIRFSFVIENIEDMRYSGSDSFSKIGTLNKEDLMTVTVLPGRYRTFNLKDTDKSKSESVSKDATAGTNKKINRLKSITF